MWYFRIGRKTLLVGSELQPHDAAASIAFLARSIGAAVSASIFHGRREWINWDSFLGFEYLCRNWGLFFRGSWETNCNISL
jgi:hypothetical protein